MQLPSVPSNFADFLRRQVNAAKAAPASDGFCKACGKRGAGHNCGPKDWANHQSDLLQRILIAINRDK